MHKPPPQGDDAYARQTILSIWTTTRKLRKCALLNKEYAQQMIDTLASKICMEDTHRSGKLGMKHGGKLLTDIYKTLLLEKHKIYPCVSREIVYEDTI